MRYLMCFIVSIVFTTQVFSDPQNLKDQQYKASEDPSNCVEDFEEDKLMNCQDNCVLVANTTQLDSDQDGFGNACDTDINTVNDCITNFLDHVVLSDAMFSNPSSPHWNADADFNGDELVNFLDMSIFADAFLTQPGPSGLADCSP